MQIIPEAKHAMAEVDIAPKRWGMESLRLPDDGHEEDEVYSSNGPINSIFSCRNSPLRDANGCFGASIIFSFVDISLNSYSIA